jgi:hypothetical protein
MAMPETNLYKLLQVDAQAYPEVIDAAFDALVRRLEQGPRRAGGASDRYTLEELTRARNILVDPVQRRAYDRQLAADSMVAVGPGMQPARRAASLSERVAQRARVEVAAGDEVIDFGRFSGWRLADVMRLDPDYLRWLSRHSSGVRFRHAILELLADHDTTRVTRTPSGA